MEEGRWSEGRPVYKKKVGDPMFLLVREGWDYWGIKSSTTGTAGWIASGRATNTPSSPEAGPSVREGVTRWRWGDGSKFVEGDISVTCV